MKRNTNILKNIYNIIKTILTIITILIMCLILIQRLFNNKISIAGYRMFTVISPSMEPEYKIFDIIISKKQDPNKLEIGDDIVYLGNKDEYNNKIITHRIIEKKEENNSYIFTTQGIANNIADPEIKDSQIYGKVIYKSEILSFLSRILNNKYGFYFLILVPTAFLIVSEIFEKGKKDEKEI